MIDRVRSLIFFLQDVPQGIRGIREESGRGSRKGREGNVKITKAYMQKAKGHS